MNKKKRIYAINSYKMATNAISYYNNYMQAVQL